MNDKRKQRNLNLLEAIHQKLSEDAAERGISVLAMTENVLAAYYGLEDLFVETKAILRAKALLEKRGYKVEKAVEIDG